MKTVFITFGAILIVILALLFGLKSFQGGGGDVPDPSTAKTQHVPAGRTLPIPTQAIYQDLFDRCDFIDYIYYDLNFSMSVNEIESVKGSLNYLTAEQVPNLDCTKQFGKIFYKSDGETLYEADLHFAPQCAYIVFLNSERKPAYACQMSPAGIENLGGMLSKVRTGPKQ